MRGPDRYHLPPAKALRRSSTRAEARLWEQLRAKRPGGLKFVRQRPIGPSFADFACRTGMIVIEVDGATHSTDAERAHDRRRTAFLEQLGYRVLRFGNDEVLNGIYGVLSLISEALIEAPFADRPTPGPP